MDLRTPNRRMFAASLLAPVLLSLVACEPPDGSPTTAAPARSDPTNTARNQRDRGTNNPTPTDQGQNAADVRITAEIRKAVMDDSTLSLNARNCKIVTQSGIVTLRGPVDSESERNAVASKATAVAGVTSVVNELEVAR